MAIFPTPFTLGRVLLTAVVTVTFALVAYRLWTTSHDHKPAWPNDVKRIETPPGRNDSPQPAMFYAPPAIASESTSQAPRPLLVALHTWSSGYDQVESISYAEWCIANRWVFVHPHFRGPNDHPGAMGSEQVITDILGAVEYAKQHSNVDTRRIFLIGESGGGYAALLVAGRAPEIWAGVSVWAAPIDMIAFYEESITRRLRYAGDIARACNGAPLPGSAAAAECAKRSASTYLLAARDVPIDLNAGIRDGRDGGGSVAISHSFNAFNLLANAPDRFAASEIDAMVRAPSVPVALQFSGNDRHYAGLPVLLRRQSHNVRLTLFDGGHQRITSAGLAWLSGLPDRK